jgi:hypothetical protein
MPTKIDFHSYVNAQPIHVAAELDDEQVTMLLQYALLRLIEVGAIQMNEVDGGISVETIDPMTLN